MNKARREAISKVIDKIEEAKWDLDIIKDEEQEAYDNMPEGLQNSEKGETMSEGLETLDSIIYNLEEAAEQLGDL